MTDRQLADRMADALEQLLFDLCGEQEAEDELEKAIGKHAVGSAQRCKQALAAFREATKGSEYRLLEEGERTKKGDQWSANGTAWRDVGRSVVWSAAKCHPARRLLAGHIVDANKKPECEACKGRGWIPLNEGSAVCEKCEGRGCETHP